MEKMIAYLSASPDLPRLFFLLFSFVLFWNIERISEASRMHGKFRHAFFNSRFIFIDAPVQVLIGLAFTLVIGFDAHRHFGMLFLFRKVHNPLTEFVICFFLLDFFEYVYHVIMHRVKPLWMFHLVHHSDRRVDVSSVFREHPGETFFRLSFTLLWVFITGTPLWIFVLRQMIQVSSNVLAHAGFRLPEKADRVVSLLFITPNMHHVHHHYRLPYTDRNYGDVLSIWDRLFGTFARLSKDDVVFGIDTCMDPKENADFTKLVRIPFENYRTPETGESERA